MTNSQPIVKIRYCGKHFYLNSYPNSMKDLRCQFQAKLTQINKETRAACNYKFRFQDLWNDMVDIQSDEDLKVMGGQTEGKKLILIEVEKVKENTSPQVTYDLKGFINFLQEKQANLSEEFKFMMEEEDHLPCEYCLGKGVLDRHRNKVNCSNCSGSGARPLTPLMNLLLKIIDYKLNERLFDHLQTFLDNCSVPPSKPPLPTANTATLIQTAFQAISSCKRSRKSSDQFKHNVKLPSSGEASDEDSLMKQSPIPLLQKKQSEERRGLLGPTMSQPSQSSNIWPAASSMINITKSPKPIFEANTNRVSTEAKLQAFATGQVNLIQKAKLSDEEQVTTKQVKYEWLGPRQVIVKKNKPTLELRLKNLNTFAWGPWLSFIIKSPQVKKAVPFDKQIPPGSMIQTTIEGLEGLKNGTLILQVKGVDEGSFTKYSSEKLELSIEVEEEVN